jgi:hypothetical protein
VETDEFNTLGIPEDSNETRGIIESWITSNKRMLKSMKKSIHWSFFVSNLETKASKWRSLVQVTFRSLGKRHGTEAVNRVLDFGFNDLNLHRIKAGCARKYSFY